MQQGAPKQRLRLKSGPAGVSAMRAGQPWPVLVVDDDPGIHAMTRLLLNDFSYQERRFEMISAATAAEAREILAARPDIPVTLLDVVMESHNSGLELARWVRETLHNARLRIILRTGQPGEAPEDEVMARYDINDYRAKTDLTAQTLFTALVGALRAWTDIDAAEGQAAILERRVEERTRELDTQRRFAETLVEMLPNPVWYKDGAGAYRLYNRAFRDLFGVGAACWSGAMAPDDGSTDSALLSGTTDRLTFEAQIAGHDGAARTVVVSKARLGAPAAPDSGVIGVITDITDRKLLEGELRRLATTDPLTGAANRRQFMAIAEQEAERSARYRRPLAVLMLDIDHFKVVNDTHGHAVGDEVLKAVADACRAGLRDVDLLGRLGGEEFAVLLPETPLPGAIDVAERLCQAVARRAVPLPGGAQIRVTASLGVATYRGDAAQVDQLLARADAALYRAKAEGRDRVIVDSFD
ncbi:MAG: diguanylate cyclase [Magnetospirillum sp.]|nr:diguanylate cyclase [Magnetospirillum sp.]